MADVEVLAQIEGFWEGQICIKILPLSDELKTKIAVWLVLMGLDMTYISTIGRTPPAYIDGPFVRHMYIHLEPEHARYFLETFAMKVYDPNAILRRH